MSKYLKNFSQLKILLPISAIYLYENEISLIVYPGWLILVMTFLKKHINYQYVLLTCISGVDLLDKSYRYCIVYELLSLTFNSRIRIKSLVSLTMSSFSVTSIFQSADWWEREIWDLFGVYFSNHPDMRRLLTDYGFEGNPLKKDFPLFGFIELRYNDSKKKVIMEPVVLTQEYRTFNFEMPW